jgi:hypothetical protein
VAAEVREAFFATEFKDRVTQLMATLRAERGVALQAAELALGAARTSEEREAVRKAVDKARGKSHPSAIKRTAFSLCVFELEDRILTARAPPIAHPPHEPNQQS